MRKLRAALAIAALALVPAGSAHAAAPVFGAPDTLGSPGGMAGVTSVAVDRRGDMAVVWRETDTHGRQTVWAATRPAGATTWNTRLLESLSNARDLAVAMTPDGTAVAAWVDVSKSAIFASVASGGGFGAPVRLATLRYAFSPGASVAALDADRVAVIWRNGFPPRPASLFDRVFGPRGPIGPVHSLGAPGATFSRATPTASGALVALVRGGPKKPAAIEALALDRSGARRGPITVVLQEPRRAHFGFDAPRIAADATGRAVVSWMVFANNAIQCQSRVLAGTPLRPITAVSTFPLCGGPGSSTPAVSITPDGAIVGAVIAGVGGSGAPTASLLSRSHIWSGSHQLIASSGWNTVPWLLTAGGGTIAVFAHGLPIVGPAQYGVEVAWRSPDGTFGPASQVGGPFFTMDAAGLSAATDGADRAVVVWPASTGGVDVLTAG